MYVAILIDDIIVLVDSDSTDAKEAVIDVLHNHPYRGGVMQSKLNRALAILNSNTKHPVTELKAMGVYTKTLKEGTVGTPTAIAKDDGNEVSIQIRVVDTMDMYAALFEALRRFGCEEIQTIKDIWEITKQDLDEDIEFHDFDTICYDFGYMVAAIEQPQEYK